MALRALIALAELAPALSALSAPAAHSNLLTREYHGENMLCGMQMALIAVITVLIDLEPQIQLHTLNVAQPCIPLSL